MINENFVILGLMIGALGGIKYLIETIQGKIQPNKVSFLLWALAPLIAFAAEIKQGVGIQALLTFSVGFGPLLIFFASFINKKADWKLGPFDFICGALSLIGLFLWYITKNGNIAIIFALLADGLASLPTIVKTYHYPETEYRWAYFTSAISGTVTLLTINTWNLAYYGFPISVVITNMLIFSLAQFKLGKRFANQI